jgi:hypothetical protein
MWVYSFYLWSNEFGISDRMGQVEASLICKCLVGFEVFTAVVTKSSIFWDITPCILLEFYRSFGRTCHLHDPPKRRLTFNGIQGVISQKMELCIHVLILQSFLCLILYTSLYWQEIYFNIQFHVSR